MIEVSAGKDSWFRVVDSTGTGSGAIVWQQELLQREHASLLAPGLPKMPKAMAQHPKTESIGSMESIILGMLEVQAGIKKQVRPHFNADKDGPCSTYAHTQSQTAVLA